MAKTNENIESKDVTEVQDGTTTAENKPETNTEDNQEQQTEKKSLLKKMKSGVDKVLDFQIKFTPRKVLTAIAVGGAVAGAFVLGKRVQETNDNQLLDGDYDTQALPDNSDTGMVEATYEEPADYVEDVNFAETEYVEE